MGICVYSPRHKGGNSVRGIEFANKLTEVYRLHLMDNLRGMPAGMKSVRCVAVLQILSFASIIRVLVVPKISFKTFET